MNNAPDKERVFVAIDILNIFYSIKIQFGETCRVDFRKLLNMIFVNQLCQLPRVLEATAYVSTPRFKVFRDGTSERTNIKNNSFLKHLSFLDLKIKNKNTFIKKDHKTLIGNSWEVGITVDALNKINEYDTFTLVSGDGDYSLLIDDLKEKNKFTEVVTCESSASKLLCAAANRTMLITENEIVHKESSGKSNKKNASKGKTS